MKPDTKGPDTEAGLMGVTVAEDADLTLLWILLYVLTSPAAAAVRQLERETNNWGSALQYFGINY